MEQMVNHEGHEVHEEDKTIIIFYILSYTEIGITRLKRISGYAHKNTEESVSFVAFVSFVVSHSMSNHSHTHLILA